MTTGRLAPPGYQWKDNNGKPLAAGLVYTYLEGTTTNKVTYQDFKKVAKNTNPVKLDAFGRADIWLDNTVKYKIVIKDKDGNQIGSTVDGVAGISSLGTGPVTLEGNLDVNGYSIVTNADKNIHINPAGTGKTNIYDPVCKDDLDLDGNDIIATDGSTVKETSTGYEILEFNAASNAVNYTAVNATATGVAPGLEAKGDDTNIGQAFQVKGNEAYHFKGTADTAAETRLYEDTDNGTNYVGLKAPASVSSSVTFTLPSDFPSVGGSPLITNGSATLSVADLNRVDYLGSPTVSGNSIDFSSFMDNLYIGYKICLYSYSSANDVDLYLDFSTDGGENWSSGSVFYISEAPSLSVSAIGTNASQAVLVSGAAGAGTLLTPLELDIWAANTTSVYTTFTGSSGSGTSEKRTLFGGYYSVASIVNGARLSWQSSAEFGAGVCHVYGIRG